MTFKPMGICGKKFSLRIPGDPASLPLIRNFIEQVSKMAGFEKSTDIVAAAEEAARNVILHAFPPGEDASFEVICEPTHLGLGIVIKEMGMPFDPSRLPECRIGEENGDHPEPAAGICMMRRIMDEVSFHNLGKGGKETRLFKYLDDRAIGSCMTAAEIEEAGRTKTAGPLPKGSVSYLVRRMEPAEAIEVSKCAYASYHYSYFYEYMYFPERIRRLNETGEMISYVAVSTTAEIMGHAAIKGDAKRGVAELMAAFVKPAYRGQGCLNALTEALIAEGRQKKYTGLFVKAVTSHNYSQKTALKFGFEACCLFLAQHDPLEFMEIPTEKREREGMLYAFLYLDKPGPFRIFPPSHHADMILQIYEKLGVSPEAADERIDLPQADSSVRVAIDPYHTARIEVLQYGPGTDSEVRNNLKALCMERIEAIYLFLNLRDPLTAQMASAFEQMGFFFAGVNPGSAGTDLLVLQFLNNLSVDYDRLRFASDAGREIAEYVRLHDPAKLSAVAGRRSEGTTWNGEK